MSIQTSAGAVIRIGDQSSPPNYVQIAEVQNIGEFGRQYELGRFNSLTQRRTKKYKGAYDPGSFTLQLGRDLNDQGQTDLEAARNTDQSYPFQIELNDAPSGGGTGTLFEFDALVTSFTTNIGGVNDFVGATAQIEVNGDITETSPA